MEIKPEGLDRPGEQAEQRLDPFDRQVAMTMAIIAAVLAGVTMLSHRAHDDSLSLLAEANRLTTASNIHHTEASDQGATTRPRTIGVRSWKRRSRCSRRLERLQERTRGAARRPGRGPTRFGNIARAICQH